MPVSERVERAGDVSAVGPGLAGPAVLFEYRDEAPLFKRLSEHFEDCVNGLHLVKRELDFRRVRL